MKSDNASRGLQSLKELMGEVENFKSYGPMWKKQQIEADNAVSYRGFEVREAARKKNWTKEGHLFSKGPL